MSDCPNFRRSRCALAVMAHLVALSTSATAQQYDPPQRYQAGRQAFDAPSHFPAARAYHEPSYPPRARADRIPWNPPRPAPSLQPPAAGPADYDGFPQFAAEQVDWQEGTSAERGAAEPAVHNDFPLGVPAKQVDWQEANECACACQCKSSTCYLGDCGHCSDRWTLFPKSKWFEIGGWVDQGVTFNFNSPEDRSNTRVFFNDRSNDYLLNQVYLHAAAPVCNDGSHWDIGGRVDINYGRDSRFITVPGLERHRDRTRKWNGENELYGLAMPQAYVEVAAPWLEGVSFKAGHFYANMGYERVAAPDNFFYSHSYSLIFGEPFTFTGAVATIKPFEMLTFNVGYTNGWDVWDSASNEWGVLAGVRLGTRDGRTSIGVQVHTGEDTTAVRSGNAFVDESRTAWTLVFEHCLTQRWRYVLQHDFGYQEDGRIVADIPTASISFDTAKWYSISQYLFFEHTKKLSSGLRVEWFRDQDGSRISVPVVFNPGGPVFTGGNFVAVTGGLNWRPHSNVVVRPELRWDWSDLKGNPNVPGGDPNVRAFVDGTRSSQFTAALDVIFHY